MNSIIFFIGVALTIMILTEGKYLLVSIEEPEALNECKNKPCGDVCSKGMCDGNGFCVNGELNPCAVHGCDGKKCGDDCLSGDIMGWCDKDLNCDYYRKPCPRKSIH